jgi:hypothetical protein
MMSRRSLIGLGAVLIVLAAASWVTSRQRYGATKGTGFEDLLDKPVDPAAVQTIRAWVGSIPDSTVELSRSGDGWVVSSQWGWKAKKETIDRLLDDLKQLRGELRSSSADVLPDYQIDDQKGMHLVGVGTGGSELFHVIVGETALRGGSFVRRTGSNDVYLCGASLRSSFGLWGEDVKAPDAKRWIELRVNQTERQDVDRIVLRDGSSEVVLEKVFAAAPPAPPDTSKAAADTTKPAAAEPAVDRANWTWKPDKVGPIDKGKADGILGTLCNLYATDVVDPKDAASYGLADAKRVAELVLKDGTKITIRFGNASKEDKKVYLQVGETGLPAKIYESTVDRVFTKRSELKPKTT